MVTTMILDFHIHSNTSSDNKMTIREAYEAAVSAGLKHICITNHHEPFEVKNGEYKQSMTDQELENTKKQICELKKDGRVKIWFGVEMSYTEEEEEDIREYLAKNDFDFVLGSVHYNAGYVMADSRTREKLKNADHNAIRQEYFKNLKKAIKSKLFDVISHLDIYKRAISEVPFSEEKYEWIDVADNLLHCGVGFEINTSHSHKITDGTYPRREVIELLVRKGLKKITIGSDAHTPQDIGRNITKIEELLKSLGIKEVYRFEKREAIPEKI